MKAMIFTIDAIFAILATITIITSSVFFLSTAEEKELSLQPITQDILMMLEKDSTLKDTIESSSDIAIFIGTSFISIY